MDISNCLSCWSIRGRNLTFQLLQAHPQSSSQPRQFLGKSPQELRQERSPWMYQKGPISLGSSHSLATWWCMPSLLGETGDGQLVVFPTCHRMGIPLVLVLGFPNSREVPVYIESFNGVSNPKLQVNPAAKTASLRASPLALTTGPLNFGCRVHL